MTRFDPTDEARGWYRAGRKIRNLQRFRSARRITVKRPATAEVPAALVQIRPRPLRARITDYIATAERFGLDAANVARAYRERVENGYGVTIGQVEAITPGFRGQD